ELAELVLASLDHKPQQVVTVGERAQLGEADRLVGPRWNAQIGADREVEAAAGDILRCRRRHGRTRTEPVLRRGARDDVADAGGDPRDQSGLHGPSLAHAVSLALSLSAARESAA